MHPATVIAWHRAGFRRYWKWKSKGTPGRPNVNREVRMFIRRMALENPFWGAPRIHGELIKLGFSISERSVLRWLPKRPRDPKRAQRWRNFLHNHREVLAAMDFLVVPTWGFRLLYALVIVDHGRRIMWHINLTAHPTAECVKQELREAFPYSEVPKYLIFDRDTTFSAVKDFFRALGIKPKITSFRSPWQNGTTERMIGTLRRDILNHVIVLSEEALRRLLKEYLCYYHDDRTRLSLNKDSPKGRPPEPRPYHGLKILALPKLGGLHHRYAWEDAA